MKIVFLQDDFPPQSFGGAGIIAFSLAKAFQKNGHSVSVISTVQEGVDEGEFEYEGLKVFRVYSKYNVRWRAYLSLYNPQVIRKIKKILNEVKPDVVHAHNVHCYLSYYSLKLAKKSGAKVFLTAHDTMSFHYGKLVEFVDYNEQPRTNTFDYKISLLQQIKRSKKRYNPFRNMVIKHYLKYVDRIFAVSNALKEGLNHNGIKNVDVIHNGVSVKDWDVDLGAVEEFKKKYNLIGKEVVLFGGRLSELKGGRKAVLAMKEVVSKLPEAVLLIIGNKNEYAEKMCEVAKSEGIEENLVFTGWISGRELKSAFNASDLVQVLSLYLDPFPTINLEAMASRKPIIGTCYGGTPEVVDDGVTGYIVNPVHAAEITDKTLDLLKNSEKAEKFGKAGYNSIKDEFNLQKSAEEYLDRFAKM